MTRGRTHSTTVFRDGRNRNLFKLSLLRDLLLFFLVDDGKVGESLRTVSKYIPFLHGFCSVIWTLLMCFSRRTRDICFLEGEFTIVCP